MRRRVTIGVVAVLLIAGILAGVGYIVADYLPRHTRIVTVGPQRFEAEAVARRAAFYLTSNNAELRAAVGRDPVEGAINQLVREETVLQAGASEVDAISDADLEAAIRKAMAVAPEASKAAYTSAYASLLGRIPIGQGEFERFMRATMIAQRLIAKYRAAIPDEGVQLLLQAAESPDKDAVQRVHDAVAAGADFAETTTKAGLAAKAEDVTLWWAPLDAVPNLKDVLGALKPGETSDVVQTALGDWATYRVLDRDERREYAEATGTPGKEGYRLGQKDQIAQAQLTAWADSQREPLLAAHELTAAREAWILKHTRSIVQDLATQSRKASAK